MAKKAYDKDKLLSVPRTPEDKEAFAKELKDFEQKYGKILSSGTELFMKLKHGPNKSIVQNAKRNIFEFPVFVASSVPLTYATATATLLEQMYASFVQMTLSQTPIVNAKDISHAGSENDPFRYLRSADINDFLESYELEFQKDSIHNIIVNEQVGNSYEFQILSYPDNEAEMILEAVEHMNVDPYEHFFQEGKGPKGDKGPKGGGKEAPKVDVAAAIKAAEEAAKKAGDEFDKKEAEKEAAKEKAKEEEFERQNKYQKAFDAHRKAEDDHFEFTQNAFEKMYGTPPKMLKEGDINKLNTMKPLMMEAHFGAYTDDGNGGIGGIEQTSMIIGVRSYCRLVNSEDLPEMAKYSDSKNVLMRHAKYRAGEMKYWSDFRFDIKGKQNDVYENIKSPEKKWYKRLYQLSHMRDDAIAPLIAKGGIAGAFKSMEKAANGMIPNCSLVISQADVDYIKAITSKDGRTGINLLNPSTAKKLCKDMFLICLVVIDPDRESVKMLIPDLNSDWEVQSIDAINRQVATMNSAGIKSNEIFKMIAH